MRPGAAPGTVALTTNDGVAFEVSSVALYDAQTVQRIASLRGSASEKLKGYSTGIGFIGSPEWVIGGSIILGAFEGLVSNLAAKAGLELLAEADSAALTLLQSSVFFDVRDIENVELPYPGIWHATRKGRRYVPNLSDFLKIRTATATVSIRWSEVTSHRVARSGAVTDRLFGRSDADATAARTFADIEEELSDQSVELLRAAISRGWDVSYERPLNKIIVSRDAASYVLSSNDEIDDFARVHADRFEHSLSAGAKGVMARAEADGWEVSIDPGENAVSVVRLGSRRLLLSSNEDILSFGRQFRYL